jgi:hypothetical protein
MGERARRKSDALALTQFRDILGGLRRDGGALSLTPLGCHDGRVVEIVLTD